MFFVFLIFLATSNNQKYWSSLFLTKQKCIFFIFTCVGFIVPTIASYWFYGNIYIEEAWLYHFRRQDLQHNFSPYFYIYHLIGNDSHRKILSIFAFIPQFVLIICCTFYYQFGCKQNKNLFMCLFVQTFIFVTLNKVITAQYFEWYMCLLPLIIPFIELSLQNYIKIFLLWSFSILQWLLPAYLFEFRKWNCFHWVGCSSLLYVLLNLTVLLFIQFKFNQKIKKN